MRESWQHFRNVYNELRNRSIFVSQLPLSQQTITKLKNHFTRLLMLQQQSLHQLRQTEIQHDLLIQLESGDEYLELETVGLFDRNKTDNVHMQNLRQAIINQLGKHVLQQKQQEVKEKLTDLALLSTNQLDITTWIAQLSALLLEKEFFHLITTGGALAPNHIFSPPAETPKLTTEQYLFLQKYRDKLITSVIGLLQSQRPNRAKPMMQQMARYLIISQSLAANTLLTLNPFSSKANLVSIQNNSELPGLLAQLQQDTIQAQNVFFEETTYIDIAYTILESSQGRWYEVATASQHNHQVRVEPGMLLPTHKGAVSLVNFSLDRPVLPKLVTNNKFKLLLLQQQIDQNYSYDLINQNCVTELIRALNSAFPNQETGYKKLGGWIEPNNKRAFIPHQFYKLITEQFPIQKEEIYHSRRLRELDKLMAQASFLSVWPKESNTISSTLYNPRTEDTPFLFFTDDTLLLRPILGISNFLWATANSVSGILTAPIDSGERFYQGLRGMFYSLPEIAFSNIRKGTYGFIEIEATNTTPSK